jgi:hypothetical protein
MMRMTMLFEAAHGREPMKNVKMATRRMGFRPMMSLNWPQRGVLAAFARR